MTLLINNLKKQADEKISTGDFVWVQTKSNGIRYFGRACQVGYGEHVLVEVDTGNRISDIRFDRDEGVSGHPLTEEYEILEVIPSHNVTITLDYRGGCKECPK